MMLADLRFWMILQFEHWQHVTREDPGWKLCLTKVDKE
jgi:hypothetical protein